MATEYVEYNGHYSGEQIDSAIATVGNLKTVATSGSYNDLTNKPTIPEAANNATLTIKKNGTSVGTFTADASSNVDVNITVPTTASDISALPASTKYAGASTAGGAATSANKLNANAGSSTKPVYFVGGLPTPCTHDLNKTVPADAVFTDTTYESKSAASGGTAVSLVTTGEKYTWNNKQSTISDLSTIRSGAALGATAVQPETGKGLSTNDYTTAEKDKLAGLTQYTDAMASDVSFGVGTAIAVNSDLNSFTTPGTYYSSTTSVTSSLTNCPTTQYEVFRMEVKQFNNTNRLLQTIYAANIASGQNEKITVFYRAYTANGWEPWLKYSSVAALYEMGSAVTSNSNLNGYTEPGAYQCSGPTIAQTLTNTPTTQPFRLEVKNFASATSLVQVITAVDNTTSGEPVVFRRVKLASGWKPWYKFTGTAVT